MVATSPVSKNPCSSRIFVVVLEVLVHDGEASNFKPAEALAVPRQLFVFVVDDLHLDAERRPALLGLDREPLIARERAFALGLRAPAEPTGLISVMPQA